MYPFWRAVLALTGAMLLGVPLSQGQPVSTVLDSLYKVAHDNNPGLYALYSRSAALHLRPSQIATFADPEIEVTWQALPLETASGPVRSQWHLRQRLPRFGVPALHRGATAEAAAAAEASAGAHVLELNLSIKSALIELYGISQLKRLLDTYEDRLNGFAEAARARYAVATGTQAELLRIQLEKNTLESLHLKLNTSLQTQHLTITRLLGTDARSVPEISEWQLPEPVELGTEELMMIAVKHRPEFRAFDAELHQSQLNADIARRELWPAFAAGVSWLDIQSHASGEGGLDALGVRLSASIPLSRAQIRARIAEAGLNGAETSARKDAFLQALAEDIATLTTQMSRYYATLELYDQGLIPQAEVVLNTTLSSYGSGQAGFLDLLETERIRYRLDVERINTVLGLLHAAAELERTLGVASLDDLQILN